MKRFILYCILSILTYNCEEPIDLEIPDYEERLVIDANFEILPDSVYSRGLVKLVRSNNFFQEEIMGVQNAKVYITDLKTGNSINFKDNPKEGYYTPEEIGESRFKLDEQTTYELTVSFDGNTYKSKAKSLAKVIIDKIEYVGIRNIENEEFAELKLFFADDAEQKNYYVFTKNGRDFYQLLNDDFFNGKTFNFSIFESKSNIIGSDKKVKVQVQQIDKTYYDYLQKLIELDAPALYGPFSTPPVKPIGNIKNIQNPENQAFGFFSISTITTKSYEFDSF